MTYEFDTTIDIGQDQLCKIVTDVIQKSTGRVVNSVDIRLTDQYVGYGFGESKITVFDKVSIKLGDKLPSGD